MEATPACAHLGLENDPFRHEDRPSPAHRCYLWMQRDRIDLAHQEAFCLTEHSARCPWLSISAPAKGPALRKKAAKETAEKISEKLDQVDGYYQRAALEALLKFSIQARRASAVAWRFSQPYLIQLGILLLAGLRLLAPKLAWPIAWLSRHYRQGLSLLWKVTLGKLFKGRPAAAPGTKRLPGEVSASNLEAVEAAEAYARRGSEAMRQGDLAAAARRFRLAVATDPGNEQAWLLLGAVTSSNEEKAECFRRVLALDPLSTRARAGLAELGLPVIASAAPERVRRPAVGAPAQAPTEEPIVATWPCARCATLNPQTAVACEHCGQPAPKTSQELAAGGEFMSAGLAALQENNEELAYHYFSLAAQTQPENELAWYWRAKTAPTIDEVVRSLHHILALNPANGKAQADLAWAMQRQQRERAALTAALAPAVAQKPAAKSGPHALSLLRAGLLQLAAVFSFLLALALALPAAVGLTQLPSSPLQDYMWLLPSFRVPEIPVDAGLFPSVDLGGAVPVLVGLLLFHAAFGLTDRPALGDRVWAAILCLGAGFVMLLFAVGWSLLLAGMLVALAGVVTSLAGKAERPPTRMHEFSASY